MRKSFTGLLVMLMAVVMTVDVDAQALKASQAKRVVNNAAGTVTVDDATNNATSTVLTLSHTTSGTPTNGLGPCLNFSGEDSANAVEVLSSVCGAFADVTTTSEDGFLTLLTRAAGGALAERLRINSTGEVGIGKTATAGVELDVQGDVASTTLAVGGGTAIAKIVKGSLADDASGWAPDGILTEFTITADAASIAATSVITVSIDQATAAVCSVYDVTAATSFKVACSAAPANAGTLQYLIVN